MNILNNKAFVMVESIVVVVFVLSLITFLFVNVLPLVGEYEKVADYDSIQTKYDIHLLRKMLLKDNDCKLQNILTFDTGKEYYSFASNEICFYLENKNYCEKLISKEFLNINKIIITKYNTTVLKDDFADDFERKTKEYINYIPTFEKLEASVPSEYFYKRRLIVIFNDGRIGNIELLKTLNTSCEIAGCI